MDKLDVESLPGVERLSQPGKKNGEIITIKENFTVFAYQWDDNSKEWKKVGEVVDSQGSESKKVYEGKEYDYVFDVELEDGRPLKLPYNVSENPYMAAQNFINRNELPPYYLDQIANFVMQNTEGAQLTQTADFSDPITGAHRYIPEPVGKSNSSYSSNNATVSDFVVPTNYKAMSSTNFEGVRKKLLQFIESVDENLKENITPEIIDSVCTNASSGKWESIDSAQAEAIITSSFSWPPEYRFPALDLLGAMVLEWTQPLAQDGMSNRICDSTILALETAALEPQSSNFKSVLGGVRLCVRLLSNMLYQQKSRTSVWSSLQAVLTILYRFTNIPNASLQTSVANLLYNLTLYGEETGQAEHAFDVITIIKEIVSNNSNNPKTLAPAVNSLLLTTGILAKKGSLYRDAIKQGIGSSAQSLESVIANPQDQELYGQVSKFF
ncbi:WD repeat protein Lub1 [Mycoemilia scoparia]|uniref:WD repeat protein Lub1 n=1 Tax=Mycoemilia scoparia TaxID=417184 RepID=A0A9W8DU74_9FUNG|nr:WD repeat protein Lub1 [Mycoemilia scoparia]